MKFSIESRFRKYTSVPLFYTKIGYQKLQMKNGLLLDDTQLGDTVALVVTGIAKPQPLVSYLKPKFKEIIHLSFRDHHQFSPDDLDKISQTFQHIDSLQKVMITTEKDLQRLPSSFVDQHPLYFLPIDQVFLFGNAHMFDAIVKRAFSS